MQNLASELQTAIAAMLWSRPCAGEVDEEWAAARSFQRDLAAFAQVNRAFSAVARGQFDRIIMLDGLQRGEEALDRFRRGSGRRSGRLVVVTAWQHGQRLMKQLRRLLAMCTVPPLE